MLQFGELKINRNIRNLKLFLKISSIIKILVEIRKTFFSVQFSLKKSFINTTKKMYTKYCENSENWIMCKSFCFHRISHHQFYEFWTGIFLQFFLFTLQFFSSKTRNLCALCFLNRILKTICLACKMINKTSLLKISPSNFQLHKKLQPHLCINWKEKWEMKKIIKHKK